MSTRIDTGQARPAKESNDALVVQALEEFRVARAMGQPNRPSLLARYPQIAEELAACLDALEFLDHAVMDLPASPPALPQPDPAPALLGSVLPLGDFRLLREIGRGGMGIVYEAEQLSLGRRVALKVLPFASALDPRQLTRFKNEVQATAQLRHPHVVQVYAVGYERGVHYFAMEFIDGRNLATAIEEWRQPSGLDPCQSTVAYAAAPPSLTRADATFCRAAAELGVQAAVALEHAHQIGVIHRDVKPANLLVSVSNHLWVTDFGLASIKGETQLTRTGDLLGTLRYMSPEQALGNRSAVDHRTDVYSLGATLYEMLTLVPAFPGENSHEILRRIVREEPPAPRRLNKTIPVDLETIVQKAMAKAPEDRYQSARELADDLNRFLRDEPIQAKRPALKQRLARWARRHQAVVWAAASLAALGVLLSLVSLLVSNHFILQEKNKARDAETVALERLFDARLAQARARRMSRQPLGQRLGSWEALTEAAQLARQLHLGDEKMLALRDEAVACLALPDLRVLKEWRGWPPGLSAGMGFSGDLTLFARSDNQGNISIHSVDEDRELVSLTGEVPAAELRFAPGNDLLAVLAFRARAGQTTNFEVWDWRRRQVVFRPQLPVSEQALDFSPDGRELALGFSDGTVRVYEVATGNELQCLEVGFASAHLAFHPDGSKIALCRFAGKEWQTWDRKSGRLLNKSSVHTHLRTLAWHPDGALLAGAGHDARVYLWNAQTGRQQAILNGHQVNVNRLAFAPRSQANRDLMLSWSWDGTCRIWDPWSARELLRFPGGNGQFSNDGTRLAFRNGHSLVVTEIIPGEEYRPLPRHQGDPDERAHDGDVSPDGRWLAVAVDAGVRVWDLPRGKEVGFLPLGRTFDVRFHPSGREFFTSGPSGLYRWPIRHHAEVVHLGPARKLPAPGDLGRIGLDLTGRMLSVVAVGGHAGGRVVDLTKPHPGRPPLPHVNTRSIATSPDGRFVATGTHNGFGVKLWEADSGRLVRHLLPEERFAGVAFSPDGRWLVIGTELAFGIWEVGSWNLVQEIAREQGSPELRNCVFSPDGKLVALHLSPSAIQLVDSAWRPVVRLQTPDHDFRSLVGFARGGQLVVVTRNDVVKVWDLTRVRVQLQSLGLDWDATTPGPSPPGSAPITRVEMDKGEFDPTTAQQAYERGLAHARAKRWEQAIEAYTKAIELDPDGVSAYHQRGHAREARGQWQDALADFDAALERQPDAMHLLVDRGRMLVRLRRIDEALTALTGTVENKRDDWSAWSVRGDVYAELSRWEEAAADFDRAASLAPTRTYVGLKQALARLAQEDREKYRKTCATLLAVVGKAPPEETARYVAWACVVASDAPNLDQVVTLAENLVQRDPDNPDHLTNLGAALFRAGRYADAVNRLTAAESRFQHARSPQLTVTYCWLFLAMACTRLDQHDDARRWLDKATGAIERPTENVSGGTWIRGLTLRLLHREAKDLVKR